MTSTGKLLALLTLGVASALPLAAAETASTTFQSSFAASYQAANDKLIQLVGAMSEDQLKWKPSDKVLDARGVLLHVAGANYFFGSRVGATLPEGLNPRELAGPEASKDELVAILKKSAEFGGGAVKNLSEADLAADMEFFGQKSTKMRFVMIMVEHAHEHLGQLIAYARANDVTPPWSQ
jgi:uncharacterized damage-inducible protein DinB